jgi:hypothetical protein
VPARHGPTTPQDNSRPRQRRRSWAATRSRNRRFPARSDRLFRPDRRWRAGPEVRANGGAAGSVGVPIDAGERHGVEQCWAHIRHDRRAGPDRPSPGRRVHIPNADGGQRPCGRAPVRERVGQPACQLVIEANYQAPSDGCRPKRGAHPTVKAVKQARIRGWWVVEAAIPHHFDPSDYPLRVRLVARRRRERRVLQRIRQWRNAGVVAQGQWPPTEVGSPPGGASAPCWRTSTGTCGTGPG